MRRRQGSCVFFSQQDCARNSGCVPVKGVEYVGPGPSGCGRYHLVGKTCATTAVGMGSAYNIVGCFEMKFFCCNEFLKYRCNFVAGKSVSPVENPRKFHGNLPTHEAGPLRRKFRQQCPGCFRLLWIIINQISDQNIRIKRNHLSFAPSATARSIS